MEECPYRKDDGKTLKKRDLYTATQVGEAGFWVGLSVDDRKCKQTENYCRYMVLNGANQPKIELDFN